MFEIFYIICMISGGVLGLIFPYFGLCFLLVYAFIINPLPFFMDLTVYHPNLNLSILIFGSCLWRGFNFSTKKLFLCMWLLFLLSGYFSDWTTEFTKRDLLGESSGEGMLLAYLKAFVLTILIVGFTKTKSQVQILAYAFMLGCFANAFCAILQKQFGLLIAESGFEYERATGFQQDGNSMVTLLMPGVALAWYYLYKAKNKLLKLFYIVGILCSIYAVFCAVSRSGLIGMGLVIGLLALKDIKRPLSILILTVGLVFTFTYGLEFFSERSMFKKQKGETKITNSRLQLWPMAIELFTRNPIKGVGPAKFAQAARQELGAKGMKIGSHNTFLNVFAEHGLLGGIPLVIMVISAFKSISRLKRSKDEFFSECSKCFQIGFLGFFLSSNFFMFVNIPFFWIVVSIPIVFEKVALQEPQYTAEA